MQFCFSVLERYWSLQAKSIKQSTSMSDPFAISKNLIASFRDFLSFPSAMFATMELDALLSWLVIPYLSSSGNCFVSL